MFRFRLLFLIIFLAFQMPSEACTIVAVAGRATADGRPMLMKNRDSNVWNLRIKIGHGTGYVYLCQSDSSSGLAYSGYNETGFAIVSSHANNMPNSNYEWNAYIMKIALERCSTVDEFEILIDTLTKPIHVKSNYGVMDAQGNVAVFEVGAYMYVRFDADSTDNGYLIRTNFSFSQDTVGLYHSSPSSFPRYQIASTYLDNALSLDGSITKEHLLGLSRCMTDITGVDLLDLAPLDENSYLPIEFCYYIPRYITTSAMVIQGVLSNEQPDLTVAWTMLGPPLTSVIVPYVITPQRTLPQKARLGADGHSWFCYQGQLLKNSCFVDNTTLDLSKLYNQANTGILQKIGCIEEEIMNRGNGLVDDLRASNADDSDVSSYYSWVDNYLDQQYNRCILNDTCECVDIVVDTILSNDTVYVYIHDTIIMIDTVFMDYFIYDTVWITDTIYIYDTIYIVPNGIDDFYSEDILLYQYNGGIMVESSDGSVLSQIALYDVNGRLIEYRAVCDKPKWYVTVPSSGVYLVKIGQSPARRIVVVK